MITTSFFAVLLLTLTERSQRNACFRCFFAFINGAELLGKENLSAWIPHTDTTHTLYLPTLSLPNHRSETTYSGPTDPHRQHLHNHNYNSLALPPFLSKQTTRRSEGTEAFMRLDHSPTPAPTRHQQPNWEKDYGKIPTLE